MHPLPPCWCGGATEAFSAEYARCRACRTLVCRCAPPPGDPARADALYGREYWFSHQRESYGLGDIVARSRADLGERNVFWLNQLLNLRLPPGKALEIGAAHGGFVHLMRQVGFDAQGLELSPDICQFAADTFGVPMLCGPVETQTIAPGSLDVIALMDVLEHLPDPLGTMRHCARLLKPDGLLLIQTPRYPAGKSFAELAATQDKFLIHLNPHEHTFLFGKDAVSKLLAAAGLPHVEFFPAIFAFYDMFLAASVSPIPTVARTQRDQWLTATPQRRTIAALLDAEERFRSMLTKYRELRAWYGNGEAAYAA